MKQNQARVNPCLVFYILLFSFDFIQSYKS